MCVLHIRTSGWHNIAWHGMAWHTSESKPQHTINDTLNMHYTYCIKFLSLTFVCTPNGFLLPLTHSLTPPPPTIFLMRNPIRYVRLVVVQRSAQIFLLYFNWIVVVQRMGIVIVFLFEKLLHFISCCIYATWQMLLNCVNDDDNKIDMSAWQWFESMLISGIGRFLFSRANGNH